MNEKIRKIESEQIRKDLPAFQPGDTVKVHYRVIEGNRERIQVFQGTVLRIKGEGSRKTFTVRKISFGVGVERVFPLHSPKIAKIEVIRRGEVRRARLYYLRERVGKATKVKEKKYISLKKDKDKAARETATEELAGETEEKPT